MDQAIQELNDQLNDTSKDCEKEKFLNNDSLSLNFNSYNPTTKNMPSFLNKYSMAKKTPLNNFTAKVRFLIDARSSGHYLG